jgi:hypothetical protein
MFSGLAKILFRSIAIKQQVDHSDGPGEFMTNKLFSVCFLLVMVGLIVCLRGGSREVKGLEISENRCLFCTHEHRPCLKAGKTNGQA